jgi:hypothetical protein
MTGHTSSGEAALIGGEVYNGMEITTSDEGLDGPTYGQKVVGGSF